MSRVKLVVSSWQETRAGIVDATMKSKPQDPVIVFESPTLLFKALADKRWELLQKLLGIGPVSMGEAARRAGRDVKAVHSDVQLLLGYGILDKTDDGKIVFPYDSVHVDFVLEAA